MPAFSPTALPGAPESPPLLVRVGLIPVTPRVLSWLSGGLPALQQKGKDVGQG